MTEVCTKAVKKLKEGEFFTKKSIECPSPSQVWVRGHYDRYAKKYVCYKFDDVNTWAFINPAREVFTEFYF